MSTVDRRPPAPPTIPLLVDGQRLGQAEFMRRYELTPPGFTAELIGGVVHVASPLSRPHGRGSLVLTTWLGVYYSRTPGVEGLENATTVMDDLGVPQPDAQLRILPECGGQTRDEGQYVGGAPELIVEVGKSSRLFDLGAKRADYERAGVREYIVVTINPDDVHWHTRRGKKLVKVRPDHDGLYRSKVFPGLWLDPVALLNGDIAAVLATLDRGLASPEHAAFVAQLADAARRRQRGQ
jgi:Uma2 family endonuclease